MTWPSVVLLYFFFKHCSLFKQHVISLLFWQMSALVYVDDDDEFDEAIFDFYKKEVCNLYTLLHWQLI